MGTEGRWELLNLNLEGLPKLLVKYVIGDAGYSVSITDLANIWIETLANQDIIRNAEHQACSINPGHDVGQLRILLEQIRHVLHHKIGTTVHLALQPPDHLKLTLRAPLPPPLPVFEWTMVLTKATQTEVVSEVISPLLLLAHQQQQQLSFLLAQLKDKDHAMSRLLDKMEATNTDLGSVFPGVSAGRNSQRSLKRNHVASRVPGLAPFQPGSELQHSGGLPSTETLYAVLRDVPSNTALSLTNSSNTWWQDMPTQQESIQVSVLMPSALDDDETDDDLDFQTQTIPEQLQRQMPANISSPVRSSRRIQRHISANDDSTDDGRIASSPPPPPALRNFRLGQTETPAPDSPSKSSNTQTRRIGAIGGRSSSQALPPSSPPKPPADVELDYGLRSRTMLSPTPSSMLPPQSQVSPSKRRRLGGIGRGSSQMQQSQPSLSRWSSQAPPVLDEDQNNADLDSGLTSTARESREVTAEVRQTRAKRKASEEKIPIPEETSAERANRKRQELKQSEKSKAPLKKKRRF
ncbi:XLF-domain-containing protein [Aureobasidium sp. EXF-10728]|nr:XLF-domain-containing protein [Aureobasidium sp. EXF-10728]